ncbi:hypothetical protein GC005_00925 [Staphylococcus pseudintermedius]|nr:hypothetical protein [Staphylococcus pseudintermedius]EHT8099250.1 hypothetical protein [Staphylococcus pseudintermedius]HDT8733365.1 hypothetical protein [Staphylococcus pseudintermedius]
MRNLYSMEYTELSNAPHFIFNGQHTKDFNVINVQSDSGLAKETFLPDRNLIVEKTRYSDKAYLLGYNEEPLKFKIRLLFDEHKLTQQNLMALRRWIDTSTFKELKFDTEEESNMHIVVYAMVTGTSELSHNVINDGYVDLEFTTNSSRRYSEILEEEYDFSTSATDKLINEYNGEFSRVRRLADSLGKSLKQYVARTNYANIEEFFTDKNKDRIPDGWKVVSGDKSNISYDDESKRITLNNVHLRKRFNGINGRNYYMRVHGNNGKIRIHEKDYEINDLGVHEFVYRRNLLGHHGTFDIDSSRDGIGEGWTKVGSTGNFALNTQEEVQIIKNGGVLTSPLNIVEGKKYVAVAYDPNQNSTIQIGDTISTNESNDFNTFRFIGKAADNSITIKQAKRNKNARLTYIRVYMVNDEEYEQFNDLSVEEIDNLYPYFDSHSYFELDFKNTEGYIDYIDLWELNPLNKKKLDSGTPIEKLVYFNYEKYLKMLDGHKGDLDNLTKDIGETFAKISGISGLEVTEYKDKITILLEKIGSEIAKLRKGDNMKLYQWDDMQPHYKQFKQIMVDIVPVMKELINYIEINHTLIDGSHEIGTDKVTIFNYGDKPVYPTFEFESVDGSDIMVNNIDTGEKTIITDNIKGEKIEMIGSAEQIYSSRPAPYYKYNSHDDVFIRLKRGYNDIEFSGNYRLKIKYQFVLL